LLGLGNNQRTVLKMLQDKGPWQYEAKWVWCSPSLTRKTLESLVRRRLVDMEVHWEGALGECRVWKINEAGKAALVV
jgi:hypothetical protein